MPARSRRKDARSHPTGSSEVAQFDVYRLGDGMLVVDLQTDLIGLEATRLVAPLRDADRYAELPGLTPVVDVDGARYVVQIPDMAAVPGARLGGRVDDLASHRDALLRAIDILTHGF